MPQLRALVRLCEDGDRKLDGNKTAAFWSALGSVMYVALDQDCGIVHARQELPEYLDVYGVSDWASDEERKRSTTGVAKIFGGHQVDAASATQPLVALSSAQAEF